ncbi:KTSC domain-containing protein [Aliirhizobium smilacinae]|uniref:KTSC domain-containing protein n=1 Tax=Aliirhizobium smilacinae TaxID=1395944 RepID=A0A5C4XRW2_9HYPH|nr:KTSC domain-containing protein [Rhizobium smilacinae]TNM65290.1 KTSC domain-containing protein [Rhizobium smilacinae]
MIYAKLKSSMLHHAEYDEEARLLLVYFRVGRIRVFSGVPREIFEKLTRTWSPGRFYLKKIRTKFPRDDS